MTSEAQTVRGVSMPRVAGLIAQRKIVSYITINVTGQSSPFAGRREAVLMLQGCAYTGHVPIEQVNVTLSGEVEIDSATHAIPKEFVDASPEVRDLFVKQGGATYRVALTFEDLAKIDRLTNGL